MESSTQPPHPLLNPSTSHFNSSHSHLDSTHLEFSHYNHLASSALTLVLNNDWNTALNLLQSHTDNSLLISATHVYVSMLKLFLHPSSFNLQPVLVDACKVVDKCKRINQELKESLNMDPAYKANQILQMLLNDVIATQCSVCISISSIIKGSDILLSAFNIKKAFVFHKKLYTELLQYVDHSYADGDATAKNNNKNNNDNNNSNNNNDLNSNNKGTNDNENIKNNDINNNTNNNKNLGNNNNNNKLKSFFGDLLKPINNRLFPDSGFNSLVTKGNNKAFQDNDDEDDEDDDEEEDNDDGKLENIYGFVDMCVWKKVSEKFDVFKTVSSAPVEKEEGIFAGMFEKKITHTINGYPTNGLTLNKTHLCKLLGLVSFGYGLSLSMLLIIPYHPLLTTAINFLGVADSNHQRPFEAFEMLTVSAFSGSFVSPISCCLLLHFLCIYRDYVNISENNFASEKNGKLIERVIGEFEKYGRESVFRYYFKAKLCVIKGKIRGAMRVLKAGMSENNLDEQIKGLCEYDLCRVYVMKFDWMRSSKSLDRLIESLVIPHPYYTYLLAITLGARGKLDLPRLKLVASMGRKRHCRKEFFSDRVSYLLKESSMLRNNDSLFKLLCYEVIYMWNGFKVLKIQQLDTVVGVCQQHQHGPFRSLACLLTGACLGSLIERKVKQALLASERFFSIESWFLQAMDSPNHPHREDHVIAMSCFQLACLKEREQDFDGARDLFKRAKSFDRGHVVLKWNMVEEMKRNLERKEKDLRGSKEENEDEKKKDGRRKKNGEKKLGDEKLKEESVGKVDGGGVYEGVGGVSRGGCILGEVGAMEGEELKGSNQEDCVKNVDGGKENNINLKDNNKNNKNIISNKKNKDDNMKQNAPLNGTIPHGNYLPPDISNGTQATLPNGTLTTLPNGTLAILPNGTLTTLSNGTLETLPNGTLTTLPNGTLATLSNGTLETLSNGTQATLSNGTLETLLNGTQATLSNGTLDTSSNGTQATLSNGTQATLSNGTLDTSSNGKQETSNGKRGMKESCLMQ